MAFRLDSLDQELKGGIRLSDVPEVQPQALTGAGITMPGLNRVEESLGVRGLKSFVNILPETVKEIGYGLGGGKITSFIAAHQLNKRLKKQGIEAPSLRETQKLIKQKMLAGAKIPEFKIKPAETVGEKAVDIATGIGKFVTKLALLKKAYPGVSGGALWEMENLTSGGIPGMGYTMHGVFSAPGKIIKGAKPIAKVGRLGLESAGLAGVTALETKIDTGEIDWKAVGISAALPVALRTPSAIKKLIKARHPKTMKAIAKIHPELDVKVKEKTGLQVIQEWGKKAKLLNQTERKANLKKLRQRQVAIRATEYKRLRTGDTPVPRLKARLLARKATKGIKAVTPEIEPLKLTPEQREFFGRKIDTVYPSPSKQFQGDDAAEAITKMETGRIPTNYEFGLLEPILGREANKELYTQLIKKRPFDGWELPALAIQFFKMKFGLDIQTFRQGRSLAVRHPIIYAKGIGTDTVSRLSNKYAEKAFEAVQNSPGYKHAEKVGYNFVGEAGYSSKRLEYYSLGLTERLLTSKSKTLKTLGKLYESSERGAVAGINTMQKHLYDSSMKQARNLKLTGKQLDVFMKNRAKTHNTFMKILRVPPDTYKGQYKGLRRLQQVANYMLFSPSMTVSRPLSIKTLIKDPKYAGSIIASNIGSIFATTAIAAIVGNRMRQQNPTVEPAVNGELNILDGMWGKIRYGNEVFDFSGGDAPFYRTIARIGVSAYMHGKGKLQDKTLTEIAGRRIPDAGQTIQTYIDTRETAAIGYARTMLTGKDWMDEPISRLEATARAVSPEVLEATIEAGMADGTWAAIATMAGTVTSVGVSSYPVTSASTRVKFKDIVAKQAHKKDWDMLSVNEQSKLRRNHRKQFDILAEKVRKERVQKPFDAKRIKEAELASGKRVLRKLSPENRQYAEDISMGLSRTPKNHWLNDERFNQYENLVSEFIEDKMSKVDFSGMNDRRRIARVQVIVKAAKNKAFSTVRREDGR